MVLNNLIFVEVNEIKLFIFKKFVKLKLMNIIIFIVFSFRNIIIVDTKVRAVKN